MKILIYIVLFVFFGCNSNTIKVDYDEFILYKINNYDKSVITAPADNITMLIRNNYSESNLYKNYYYNIEKYGYYKTKPSKDFINRISDVFVNKKEFLYSNYKCMNAYTDIIVFKKKGVIIGVAKFDFDCNNCVYLNFDKTKKIYIKNNCMSFKNDFYPFPSTDQKD